VYFHKINKASSLWRGYIWVLEEALETWLLK